MTASLLPYCSLDEFASARILIVDDEPSNRILLRSVCEKIGIGHIDEAEDGLMALERIAIALPDIILLDIRMPRMDGNELIRHLRSHPLYENIAILVQTRFQDEDSQLTCFDLGVTDIINRPFHLNELKARLRAHLRSALSSRMLFDFRNRIQAHIDITKTFLSTILPTPEQVDEITTCYGLDCSFVYRPHDEIGGDLWALRPLDEDTLAIKLIDASAHGLAGAINALRVDCLVQENFESLADPGVFLKKLDVAMAKIAFGQLFAGGFAMTFHKQTGLIRYCGTGIPSPLLKHGDIIHELKTSGLPLGSDMMDLQTATTTMDHGDTLILFSDGWADSLKTAPHDALRNSINAKILTSNLVAHDDLTLITLHRR